MEEVRDGDPDMEYPAFVDGARRCPPEDVGGLDGFMDFLEAILDPAHEEHRAMLDWYGGPFDPSELDEARAYLGMANMARPARQPKERIAASEAMSRGDDAYGAANPQPATVGGRLQQICST